MNECTERARRWPDEPTDVSPDELDAFLTHARYDVCPFHAEKVRAEEERMRSEFRLARGLDSHGRILRGRELKATITKHQRRQARWKETAQRMEQPFKRIYLSNCGEDIAGSGKFYDFRRYEGDHLLNPKAGLQIWGVLRDEMGTEEVLLGFHPLAGVRHTGEETFIPLANGYTVGLKVMQLDEQLFNIKFRCVENEVLEKERADLHEKHKKADAARAVAGGSLFTRFSGKARICLSWVVPSRERLVPRLAVGVLACLFIGSVVKVVPTRDISGLQEKPPSTAAPKSNEAICAVEGRQAAATKSKDALTNKAKMTDSSQRRNTPATAQPAALKNRRDIKPPRAGSTREMKSLNTNDKGVLAENKQAALQAGTVFDTQGKKLEAKRQPVWYLQSVLSDTDANKWFIVHSGKDAGLREKLFAEIQQRAFDVSPLSGNVTDLATLQQFTVAWDITRQDKFVTVKAILTGNGESKELSFRSEGSCPEQACAKAVKDAVTGVFAVMQTTVVRKADGD